MSIERIGIRSVSTAIATLEDINKFYNNYKESFDTLAATDRIAKFKDLKQYTESAQSNLTQFMNDVENQIIVLQGVPAFKGGRRSRLHKTRKNRK
jgi:hypothetical protein